MAKLIYDHDGVFTVGGKKYEPHVEHQISDEFAAEVRAALPHFERKGFRLIEDEAAVPPSKAGVRRPRQPEQG